MLFFWTNTSPELTTSWNNLHRVTTKIKLSEAVETITPEHEQDRTVFENDWTNIWSSINFRLFLLSPKKSHTRFMSSLSRTKGFISVNIRLFTGSSVKHEWSSFLFWALNPRSQGTMPTGMIRVRMKSEQLDYLAAAASGNVSKSVRVRRRSLKMRWER